MPRQRGLRLNRTIAWRAIPLLGAVAIPLPGVAQEPISAHDTARQDSGHDPLLTQFRQPPQAALPRTWWHWLNGNVTQEGITADLEWMHRVGIGGVHYFDAGGRITNLNVVDKRIAVGHPQWQAAIRHAATLADRMGMEFTTAAAPGWSETGGPWVTPEQAMKKYVWSEMVVPGGKALQGRLPPPPDTTGAFQTMPLTRRHAGEDAPSFYRDAMVVAYRLPRAETRLLAPKAITVGGRPLDAAQLADGDFVTTQTVTGDAGDPYARIVLAYARPVTVRGIELGMAGRPASDGDIKPRLEISDDGRNWHGGTDLSGPGGAPVKTYSFAPLTARYFRLSLPEPPRGAWYEEMFDTPRAKGPTNIALSELRLVQGTIINRFLEKAGFADPIDYAAVPTAPADPDAVVQARDVIDLSGRMAADGTLDWTPPRGQWKIIRLGYSLTGRRNNPAPPEATGLEVDKFSARHVRDYLNAYLGRFEQGTGPELIGRRGLQNLISDSWEAGVQNWTDDMPADFKRLRGYNLAPWLPVLTGRIVGSAEASDRFLWDYRRTLQDLLAQHYEVLHAELAKRHMGFYAEAQGSQWRAIGDGMEMKARADIPMAEYWYEPFGAGPGQPTLKTDMKEAASVAHLYGKPLVANESLTVFSSTPWAYPPAKLKPVIDEIFAYGVNRFVLHTSVHQPFLNRKPGVALGPFGQYLTRNESWAEQAGPFFSYIARASSLLQQGSFVADIAYFYGEDRPLVSLFQNAYDEKSGRYLVEVPPGFGFDFMNGEALRTLTAVEDGQLTTKGGMRYKLLFLGPDTQKLTLPTLLRIEQLVQSGMTLVGDRPRHGLGLASDDAQIARVADRIWGTGSDPVRSVGKGRVLSGMTLPDALARAGMEPDVRIDGAPDTHILQLHRRLSDGRDIYFLTNRKDRTETVTISFRTVGRTPQFWSADTGSVRTASFHVDAGRTVVPVTLGPLDSVFVVFNEKGEASATVPAPRFEPLFTLEGDWTISFAPGLGAPPTAKLPRLSSWSDNIDAGIRYFSGTGTYHKSFTMPAASLRNRGMLRLDLGDVREVAQVKLNGQDLGILWKPPYQLDISNTLRPGQNRLEIAVTNLWPNRIIGDLQPGVGKKISWTPETPLPAQLKWKADSPLMPSGLLGPVRIEAALSAP